MGTLLKCILAAGILVGVAAEAAPMRYSFAATGFPIGLSVPVDPVNGSFVLDFDFQSDATDVTARVALESLNLPLGSVLAYTYDTGLDRLWVGGIETGANNILNGTNDFRLVVDGLGAGAPVADRLVYTLMGVNGGFTAQSVDLRIEPVSPTTPVPLPTPLAMLTAALGGFALVRRRRTRGAA
jgi:hypothetical protein